MLPVSRSRAASAEESVRHRLSELGLRGSPPGGVGGDPGVAPEPVAAPGSRPSRVRLDPGRPGALLLCAVAVTSAVIAAGVTWAGRPAVEALPPVPVAVADSAAGSGGTPAESAAAPSSEAEIVVAVVGLVVTPGLVTLPAGSRVADAIAAAGGALPGADLATVNLARVLADGEQVAVGVPGAADDGVPPAAGGADPAGPVNLNTATEAELEELPGVGPVLAGRIVQWRSDNGDFTSVDQLQEVDGIGPSTFEDLRDEVTV